MNSGIETGTLVRTAAGLVIWTGLMVVKQSGTWWASLSSISLFGLLVIVPIALALAEKTDEKPGHLYQTSLYLQPFAGLITGSSFLIPQGVLAGTLAIAWVPVTGLVFLSGVQRQRNRPDYTGEDRIIDLALMTLPVSAILLWSERMGLSLFGLADIELLTLSNHVFFAGSGGILLTGLIGRRMRALDNRLSIFLKTAFLLVLFALFSYFWQPPEFSLAAISATTLQAAAILWLALLILRAVVPYTALISSKFFLYFSAVSGVLSSAIVLASLIGSLSKFYYQPSALTITAYGWLVAAGFIGCGLVGFQINRE